MPPLRDLVRDRLKALGDLRQQDFAARLNVDPRYVSAVLTGERPPPLDQAAEWARALECSSEEEVALIDAMHLAACTERVQSLVDRLQAELATMRPLLARYRDRIGHVRYILDHVEPGDDGGRPPLTAEDRARVFDLVDDLIRERNRIVHRLPDAVPKGPASP